MVKGNESAKHQNKRFENRKHGTEVGTEWEGMAGHVEW